MKSFANLFVLILTLSLAGCGPFRPVIQGSGNVVSEKREIKSFEKIRLSGSGSMVIQAGSTEPELEVQLDDNLLSHLSTEVVDGELRIRFTENVSTRNSTKLTIATEHLSKLTIEGAGDANIEGLDEADLSILVSGSGKITCAGKAQSLSLSAAGSAKFECLGLDAEKVKIDISGSGNAIVSASQELDVSITGSGNVQYTGTPNIKKSVAGSGSIKPLPSK